MTKYLYRYLSFEAFVDMVQRQELTFVLPSLWDDTAEMLLYDRHIENLENAVEKGMFYALRLKTYAQCWTKLKESDAMWRIYGYNNTGVRIKIRASDVELLDNVHCIDVKYVRSLRKVDLPTKGYDSFLQSLAVKRLPFQHEKEVRLIHHYQFKDSDDALKHIKSLLAIGSNDSFKQLFPDSDERTVEEKVFELIDTTNMNEKDSVKYIKYSHIPKFIQSVSLHPFAADWFENTLRTFCAEYDIFFEGKSRLYCDNKDELLGTK